MQFNRLVYHQSQIRDPGLVNIIKLEYTLYLDLDNLVKKFILQYLKKYKRSRGLTTSGIAESLERFSDATGGRALFVNQTLDLKNALRLIKQELSHQYIIGYTSYSGPDNEYRKIKVVMKKKNYRVRTREGYYSGKKKDTG